MFHVFVIDWLFTIDRVWLALILSRWTDTSTWESTTIVSSTFLPATDQPDLRKLWTALYHWMPTLQESLRHKSFISTPFAAKSCYKLRQPLGLAIKFVLPAQRVFAVHHSTLRPLAGVWEQVPVPVHAATADPVAGLWSQRSRYRRRPLLRYTVFDSLAFPDSLSSWTTQEWKEILGFIYWCREEVSR